MDNMNNVQPTEPKENNKKIVIVSAIAIAALVAVFVIVGVSLGWFGGSKKQSAENNKGTAPTIKIIETKGSEGKTTKVKISVRDVKFGDKIKEVKKFEKKQKDTINSPTEAKTKDGYTYLTYQFDTKNAKYYGVKPAESTRGSLLQYVFYKKKLFDIRLQYGDISSKDRAKLKKNIIKQYGKPTFASAYSNKNVSVPTNWYTFGNLCDKA